MTTRGQMWLDAPCQEAPRGVTLIFDISNSERSDSSFVIPNYPQLPFRRSEICFGPPTYEEAPGGLSLWSASSSFPHIGS
jgi:hypothetical protein